MCRLRSVAALVWLLSTALARAQNGLNDAWSLSLRRQFFRVAERVTFELYLLTLPKSVNTLKFIKNETISAAPELPLARASTRPRWQVGVELARQSGIP